MIRFPLGRVVATPGALKTLLVNPLRNPLAANLFSVKYYKKYLCIL
jgi:hypothetical protein